MSKHKHNYTQYSNKNHQITVENVDTDIPKVTPITEGHPDPVGAPGPMGVPGIGNVKLVNETIETKAIPKTVEGMVVGCAKLNVRAEANLFSDVICTLNATSEIEINIEKSTKDWFYICTASGIEGYCMRKYVEAHL